jgi:hypothetical protein
MGAPISNLVAEIFLLHFEYLVITLNIDNKSVISEAGEVDGILITCGHIRIVFV